MHCTGSTSYVQYKNIQHELRLPYEQKTARRKKRSQKLLEKYAKTSRLNRISTYTHIYRKYKIDISFVEIINKLQQQLRKF